MKFKYLLLIVFIALGTQLLSAQHIKLDKKEMAFLASQKKINVVFTYESVLFNADSLTETGFVNYIKGKIESKLNAEEALDWEKRYFNAKDSIYPKIFATALNNRIKDYDYPIEFVVDDNSTYYTMKVQTDWMYFGYDVGIAKQPAKANLKVTFYETSNPENIVSKIDIDRAEGFNVIGNLSFNTEVPLGTSGISSTNWLQEFLKANEDYPKPSLIRMGNMYDKAAVRFGMTLKRVLD
ncbi:hypothetical protein [Aequorivita antarctica]|uniref:Uncharacterized protein n=1 Tax=Aequorivita antarctica TaxID=153266 RepID=A0A5C6YZQ1_9FLAO|nr:hypothetical protein [Aequorivita antarctica]TXD72589.1 hypothetical protein ESU54_12305 [Aequorivita antarctica]SRX76134.1 hypothetical protein AEQU3_03132 [Aequorivita antarctica]